MGPLEGVRILEATHNFAGPNVGTVLADLGAPYNAYWCQHNQEVYEERMGLSAEELRQLQDNGVI